MIIIITNNQRIITKYLYIIFYEGIATDVYLELRNFLSVGLRFGFKPHTPVHGHGLGLESTKRGLVTSLIYSGSANTNGNRTEEKSIALYSLQWDKAKKKDKE